MSESKKNRTQVAVSYNETERIKSQEVADHHGMSLSGAIRYVMNNEWHRIFGKRK